MVLLGSSVPCSMLVVLSSPMPCARSFRKGGGRGLQLNWCSTGRAQCPIWCAQCSIHAVLGVLNARFGKLNARLISRCQIPGRGLAIGPVGPIGSELASSHRQPGMLNCVALLDIRFAYLQRHTVTGSCHFYSQNKSSMLKKPPQPRAALIIYANIKPAGSQCRPLMDVLLTAHQGARSSQLLGCLLLQSSRQSAFKHLLAPRAHSSQLLNSCSRLRRKPSLMGRAFPAIACPSRKFSSDTTSNRCSDSSSVTTLRKRYTRRSASLLRLSSRLLRPRAPRCIKASSSTCCFDSSFAIFICTSTSCACTEWSKHCW
mmetsp:Transcript_31253/g.93268  ORF Transcript_31253/g.93268 Transcript_31253/m.93268 type:complete len:315 (-) Transcript_31253:925-1869(-)